MASDEEKISKSAYEELQITIGRRLDAQSELNQKAIEIVKIDLLTGSIIATSIPLLGNNIPVIYLIGGSIALIYSIWSCLMTISLRDYSLGIGPDAVSDIDDFLDKTVEEHNRELIKTYRSTLQEIQEPMGEEAAHFKAGLWSSLTAILFFLTGGFRLIFLPTISISYDIIPLILIPVLVLSAKSEAEAKQGKSQAESDQ